MTFTAKEATKYGGMDLGSHNCTAERKIYPPKLLTNAAVIAYNLRLQGCPCMGKALNHNRPYREFNRRNEK